MIKPGIQWISYGGPGQSKIPFKGPLYRGYRAMLGLGISFRPRYLEKSLDFVYRLIVPSLTLMIYIKQNPIYTGMPIVPSGSEYEVMQGLSIINSKAPSNVNIARIHPPQRPQR